MTDPISESGYLRLPDVLKLIPISKSAWWDGVKKGYYPQGIKLAKRVTAWRIEDIRDLINKLNSSHFR